MFSGRKERTEGELPLPEKSNETVFSLANQPAGLETRRFVLIVAVFLSTAFAALLPFAGTPMPEFSAFVPSSAAVVLINDLITAVLLYAQCAIAPSRSFLLLASGYLFTALIMIPHALSFPGAFTATGLIGAGPQTAPWLYFSSHLVSPAVLLGYARLKDVDRPSASRPSSTRSQISVSVVAVVAFVCGLTLMIAEGSQYLPAILTDRTHTIPVHLVIINISIIAIAATAFAELWSRRRTVLDYWLMLISVALIQEQVFFALGAARFSLGCYAGRVFSLIASVIVLILLLQETTRLYARLAHAYAAVERERNNKLVNAEAITASIVHEVRQPPTAIAVSGVAALQYLKRPSPDHEKVRDALNRMIGESHRTSEVLDGIRSMFGRADQKQEAVDVDEIVRDVLEAVNADLMENGVTAYPEFAELPLVDCHRNQLQQVIYNLVQNALEAMQTVAGRKRAPRVRTECRSGGAVAVVIEDSGPGINPSQVENIFGTFVTTKPHGMGLGLAICRQIVERHGGELVAYSDGSSGAQFRMVLPVRQDKNSISGS
ncbi:ATP-binding protein [Bradyrhizobium liaoningense]|uniref:ATP-binding protein n=1 Tax=Bradyrhizobium liaoningense TaxID=43992 RepID=UPI001BA84F77|nr:ATP-binding protein [Bradyrhizobium liaoningense]MBR0858291.1 MASE4 domain-containing protein [Bradyrhizobium liaoningense]